MLDNRGYVFEDMDITFEELKSRIEALQPALILEDMKEDIFKTVYDILGDSWWQVKDEVVKRLYDIKVQE